MSRVRIDQASRIKLPRDVREAAHVLAGDELEVVVTESGILLRPIRSREPSPTAEDEALIQAVVDEERRAYAAERRR